MKAVVQDRYGPPELLELRDVAVPALRDDEVLVRVHAAGVNPYDWVHVLGAPYLVRLTSGPSRPRVPVRGCDVAGVVAAVGRGVDGLRPGTEVFGWASGTFAEYAVVRPDRLVVKPAAASFVEAAAVPLAGLTALQGLRDRGRIRSGQRVLVNGASGGVGTFAVQLAKVFGAEVTAVCSPRNAETARLLGADHVVDYTREDFVGAGPVYDLVLDIAGTRSVADRRRALTPDGTLVVVGGPKTNRWVGPLADSARVALRAPFTRQRLTGFLARPRRADLQLLADLVDTGDLRAVVERTHPLADAAAALRYVGDGHAQGKIVLTVAGDH